MVKAFFWIVITLGGIWIPSVSKLHLANAPSSIVFKLVAVDSFIDTLLVLNAPYPIVSTLEGIDKIPVRLLTLNAPAPIVFTVKGIGGNVPDVTKLPTIVV